MFKKYLGILFVSVLFAVTGCQNANEQGTSGNACYEDLACDAGLVCLNDVCQPTNEINTNTVVITTMEANNNLVNANIKELTFVRTERNEKFEKGQIIAFQKNDKIKGGLVAKIESIQDEGDNIKLNIKLVNPFLALGKTKLEINRIVTENPNSDLFIPNKQQIEKFKNLRKDDLRYSKSKTFNYEKSWKGDVLKFKGSLKLSYLLEALIDVNYPGSFSEAFSSSNYGLNEFEIKNTFKANVDATLDIHVEKDAGFQEIEKSYAKDIVKNLSLASFPITLPVSAIQFMGHVDISLKLIPKAHIEGKAHVEASSHNTIKANLHYLKQKPADWDKNYNKTFDYKSTNELSEDVRVEGNASVTLKITPAFKITANAGFLGEFAKVEFGTDVEFTPIKLQATLKQHFEADNNSFGVDARACFRADAELTINPYALIEMSFMGKSLYSKKWNAEKKPKVKGWSWLDFLTKGAYFGDASSGCHEGLEPKDGKCRAKEFWSVVGKGKEGLDCVTLLCNEHKECQVNADTSKDKCIRHRCVTPDDDNNHNGSYEMVTIPEGTFTRGCVEGDEACLNAEKPAKQVQMPEYKIGKKEVTIAQYKQCVDAGKCKAPTAGEYVDGENADNHPITNVSWEDAYTFCRWVGDYRLPTEAEWERAAKGNSNNKYVWGNDDPSCDLTVMEGEEGNGCGEDSPADVGTKASDSSSFGVMDLAGNVKEWTNDYFDPSYYKKEDSVKNPKGPKKMVSSSTYVTVRGGSWNSHVLRNFRNSNRAYITFTNRANDLGFRCAK